MEQWQLDAIHALFETKTNEVEPGTRVYVSSKEFGTSRYHLIEKRWNDGVQIEQIETDEKWSKRLNFSPDEMPAILKTLLTWHLEKQKEVQEWERVNRKVLPSGGLGDDSELGPLDDHPF